MNFNQSLIEEFFKRIIGPLGTIPLTPLMIEPDDSEERVALLTEQFNLHSTLISPFGALIKAIATNPDDVDPVLEEKIRFYRTKHTRNWLMVNFMNQTLNVKDLKLDLETGRLPGKPHELLKFASESQVAFGEESRYKDLAYAGGLMFDYLFYLQRTSFVELGNNKFDEAIKVAHAKAVEQGKLIANLARYKPKLTLERYAFLTAYFRQLAQVSLYLLKPHEAPEFYKKLPTIKQTETVRLALEMKTFGVHTGMLATYFAQSMPIFGQLGEAMSVWGAPYLSWVHAHREIHDLSAIGLFGVSANEYLAGVELPTSCPVGIILPELKYFDLEWNPEVKREAKI